MGIPVEDSDDPIQIMRVPTQGAAAIALDAHHREHNLLTRALAEQRAADQEHTRDLLAEKDKRDQQRYDAQVKALEAALLAQQTAVAAALLAAEKAVTKAEIASEKRFDGINEFRGAYADIIAAQLPRTEADARFSALAERMDSAIAAAQERIEMLAKHADQREGRGAGIAQSWALLSGAIVLAIAVITVVLALRG
jgi:hypothetical protein